MSRHSATLKRIGSALIIACIAFFFYKAFQRNWASIRAHEFDIRYGLLSLSALCVLAGYLLSTYAWHVSLNSLSSSGGLTFSQSVAVFNVSGLSKYVPGKFWSYGLQMYWLSHKGFSKSLILYVNLANLFVSIITSVALGLALLLLSPNAFPAPLTFAVLVLVLLFDLCSVRYYSTVFGAFVALANKLFKREIAQFELNRRLMLELHGIHLLSALASGIGVYLVCLGVGYDLPLRDAPLLMASTLISDVVGILAVFVPGGLGVREGIMYLILGGASIGSLSLILPIASRCVSMLVDAVLGGVALSLLRKLTASSLERD